MAFSDFHVHTRFSDGEHNVRECIEAAHQKGLLALGISDHSFTPFDTSYCMRPETGLAHYEETVREEAARAKALYGMPVLLGLEHDFGSVIDRERYDYTIGSVHYILKGEDIFPVDDSESDQLKGIAQVFGGNKLDFVKRYFEQVVLHAEKNKPTFMGHFDIVNKYSLIKEDEAYFAIAKEALAETVKHVPLFEISAGPMLRGLKDHPYPALPLLQELKALGGKVILSSDTHSATTLCAHFQEMLTILKKAGFTHVCTLQKGGISEIELDTL